MGAGKEENGSKRFKQQWQPTTPILLESASALKPFAASDYWIGCCVAGTAPKDSGSQIGYFAASRRLGRREALQRIRRTGFPTRLSYPKIKQFCGGRDGLGNPSHSI